MSNNVKKRNWAFVLYPDSAPSEWKDILQNTGLQCAISPLHDNDINPTGELKKAHYHIILCYSGPTSFNVVKNLCDILNQPIPQALEQVRGYYRYLSHKDNPEKYQYNENEITFINGFYIGDFTELTKSELIVIKKQIHKLIRDLGFLEYSDLMNYLYDNDMIVEYDVASCHTFFFDKLITSCRNKYKKSINHIDKNTGEVIE